ncbi:MAG: hypothetical protein JW955_15315 [Sedimentisphaerales bacterium]|nr:hypothetical protein [Sedimentisphaerales bacterium]
MKSPEEQEQAFQAFERYLEHIVNHPAVRLVTAREIPSLYPDRVYSHPLTRDDIRTIAEAFQKRLSFVDLSTRVVSAAEGLSALSQFVAEIDNDSRPAQVSVEFAYGTASKPQRFITTGTFSWNAIREAARELVDAVRATRQLPALMGVAGQPVRPEDFAVTLAGVVASGRYSGDSPLRQGELEAARYAADDSPRLWGWVIFPEGFRAPRMMEIAKLQAWTIKPAVLRKHD